MALLNRIIRASVLLAPQPPGFDLPNVPPDVRYPNTVWDAGNTNYDSPATTWDNVWLMLDAPQT
jgi:hypothetical protein